MSIGLTQDSARELAALNRKYCITIGTEESKGYFTARVAKITSQLEKEKVPILGFKDTVTLIFEKSNFSKRALKSITELRFIPSSRQLVVRSDDFCGRRELFDASEKLSFATGWYFYLTGSTLPEPEIKAFVDEILRHIEEPSVNVSSPLLPMEITNQSPQNSTDSVCLHLKLGKNTVFFDCGPGSNFTNVKLLDCNFGVISHAHTDHFDYLTSGRLKESDFCPLIMTKPTLYLIANAIWESGRSTSEKEKHTINSKKINIEKLQ